MNTSLRPRAFQSRAIHRNTDRATPGQPAPIRAALIGSDRCEAEGISVRAVAPVLALCRKLVTAGHDPERPLHAYRGNVLALRVRSIGEGAQLAIAGDGVGFRRRKDFTAASRKHFSKSEGSSIRTRRTRVRFMPVHARAAQEAKSE